MSLPRFWPTWRCSNAGYIALGVLIERMTGRSYGENLQAEFFSPLGMTQTGKLGQAASEAPCARRSIRVDGTLRAADPVDPNSEVGAGNLYSTAGDRLRWQRALYGGQVLQPASLKAMTTPVRNDCALGLDVDVVDGRLRYQHHGVISEFSPQLLYKPREALTIGRGWQAWSARLPWRRVKLPGWCSGATTCGPVSALNHGRA
jgi:CubicO group peptidase (beta-lactamase class C family)